MESRSLRSVKEVFGERYLIPDYQRGYKWTKEHVRKLLNDVNNFHENQGTLYYCLQNITLVDRKDYYEVVDGQQRITTLLIILSYFKCVLENSVLDAEQISISRPKYQAREAFGKFIESYIINGSIWTQDISDEQKNQSSDIWHLCESAQAVAKFFEELNLDQKRIFAEKLVHSVKLLWNVVPKNITPELAFSKVNGLRVPLDGADLLRAIFITLVPTEKICGSLTEREVCLAEDRVKLGIEMDSLNEWWGEPLRCRYFRMLLSSCANIDGGEGFDIDKYPINLLYRLFVAISELSGTQAIKLDFFEEYRGGKEALYRSIKRFNEFLVDVFLDRRLYHFVGILCGQLEMKFTDVYRILNSDKHRNEIYRELKLEILKHLRPSEEENPDDCPRRILNSLSRDIRGNKVNWYEDVRLKKVLVLMDVIALTKNACDRTDEYHTNLLADRMDPCFFKCEREDKEHIFPQTPISTGNLKSKVEKLNKHLNAYCELISKESKKDRSELEAKWAEWWNDGEKTNPLPNKPGAANSVFPIFGMNDDWYKWLNKDEGGAREVVRARINGFVMSICGVELNSIGNIVMLHQNVNRSYGNWFYTLKRCEILRSYTNDFKIHLHTRSVFAKEFLLNGPNGSDGNLNIDVWNQEMIMMNRFYIARTIDGFFKDVVAKKLKKETENV